MNFIARQSDKAGLRARALSQLSQTNYVAPILVKLAVLALEVAMLVGGGLLVAGHYPGFGPHFPLENYVLIAPLAAVLHIGFQKIFGLYRLPALLNPLPRLSRLASSWVSLFAVLATTILMAQGGDNYSRIWLSIWFGAGFCFLVAGRVAVSVILQSWNKQGQFNRNAIIVGSGELAERTVGILNSSRDASVNLVGFFDDRSDARTGTEMGGLRKLGNIDDLVDFARMARIDLMVVAIPPSAETRLMQILDRLNVLPVDVRVSAVGQKLKMRPRAYSHIGNLPCLDILDRPLGDWGPVLKSLEDKFIATIALIVLSPVMLALAIAVKLDSKGPALFKQKRYGFNNELIEVYKFRSMYQSMSDPGAVKLVTKSDARVTRVGRIIRRTSLDELPQLFNVLKGELSLVGPRPHATKARAGDQLYEHIVDGYFARHKVRPGMTGWAQINGWRGETDTAEKIQGRVDHDIHYIENWSLMFDLYILAKTPLALLNPEGAY
jgi:Undecaprenyl-phosphate glucose phosphotransferase